MSDANAKALIKCVKTMGKSHKWGRYKTRNVAMMSLMTALVESGIQNYANSNVKGSLALPHDRVGSDHDSVGIMQQRVGYDGSGSGGWGSLKHCQSVPGATWSFVMRLITEGLVDTPRDAHRMGVACQTVQVSAFPDRYQEEYARAESLCAKYFGRTLPIITRK